jgi:hypothetical protein
MKVTIWTVGHRDFLGSRVVRDERVESVQVNDGISRPPKNPTSLGTALDWLGSQGFEPESTNPISGHAVWVSLGTGIEARRRCTFIKNMITK